MVLTQQQQQRRRRRRRRRELLLLGIVYIILAQIGTLHPPVQLSLVSRGFSQFYHQLLYSRRKSEGRPQEEGATGRQSFCCGQLGKNSFNSSARGSAKPDKPEVSAPFSCDFPGFPMVWQEKAPWVGPKKGSWVKILRPESYW